MALALGPVARLKTRNLYIMLNARSSWYQDQNVVRIVLYGSKKPILQEEALAIFAIGVNNQIRLELEWILREENELADYLSRVFDYDD